MAKLIRFYRINALAGLSDKSALTSALRNAVLLRSNGDELLLRDAQALLDGSKNRMRGLSRRPFAID